MKSERRRKPEKTTVDDLENLKQTGIYGVAISSVILESQKPNDTIKQILDAEDLGSLVSAIKLYFLSPSEEWESEL